MVRIKSGNVTLSMAARSWTLVAFCKEQIEKVKNYTEHKINFISIYFYILLNIKEY